MGAFGASGILDGLAVIEIAREEEIADDLARDQHDLLGRPEAHPGRFAPFFG